MIMTKRDREELKQKVEAHDAKLMALPVETLLALIDHAEDLEDELDVSEREVQLLTEELDEQP